MDYGEVAKHNSADSCWVILYGNVYDVTNFIPEHPGGTKVILQLAGQDATEEYDPVHPPGTLESSLPASSKLGPVDRSTLPASNQSPSTSHSHDDEYHGPPPIDTLLNLDDFEFHASHVLSDKAWAYYYSASDDLHSKSLNSLVYHSVLLRPRIFVDVTKCDTSTTLLRHTQRPLKVNVPFFVSPAAMARLAHPAGEHGIAQACARLGAAMVISNNASMTPEQIVAGAPPSQIFGWQLYVQTDRAKSEAMLARINHLPAIKFLVLTLDAPVPGKRELDERQKNVAAHLPVSSATQAATQSSGSESKSAGGGLGRALFAGTAADLTWTTTLRWLRQHTSLPIVLKGIQTYEDAALAAEHRDYVAGIILSNHGGRAADTAPPALHTLVEIRRHRPAVLQQLDVWLDGGVRRGTDVAKALALGARAVGLGRAPLYGLGVGGVAGVERVLTILKEETETAMRLLGVQAVQGLNARCVNARALERDVFEGDELVKSKL